MFTGYYKKTLIGLMALTLASVTSLTSPAAHAAKYSAIVVDGKTGKVLHASSADAPRFPASLTKIMTLYVLFDYLTKKRLTVNTKFYVTPYASSRPPTKMGLRAGKYVKVKDLIGSLVTKSANDGAVVVAENLAGSVPKFARLMTRTARKMGMSRTTFKNPSGLPNWSQKTTARDMAILSVRIMNDFPKLSRSFKMRSYTYKRKRFGNHNRLLGRYRGVEGIKTGYTRASGFNLTTSVRRNGKHVIAVVMGGRTGRARNAKMRQLLNRFIPKARSMRGRIFPQVFAGVRMHKKHATRLAAAPAPRRRKAKVSTVGTPATGWTARSNKNSGGYDVQVGAFTDPEEAKIRIKSATNRAKDILKGHSSFTMKANVRSTTYYRARFANFTKRSAKRTCSKLKSRGITCVIMTSR